MRFVSSTTHTVRTYCFTSCVIYIPMTYTCHTVAQQLQIMCKTYQTSDTIFTKLATHIVQFINNLTQVGQHCDINVTNNTTKQLPHTVHVYQHIGMVSFVCHMCYTNKCQLCADAFVTRSQTMLHHDTIIHTSISCMQIKHV